MRGSAAKPILIALIAMAQPLSGGVTPGKGVAATRCPVVFRADQHDVGGGRTVWTVAFEDRDKKDKWWPESGSMGVHVVFAGARSPMRSLEFSVSYLPPGTHVMPAPDAMSASELKKSYTLMAHDRVPLYGDLLVGPASMITRVRLVGATFADGTAWHAASDTQCSVEPSRVLPVDGKESSLKW